MNYSVSAVSNVLATPAAYASTVATRPASAIPGTLFFDTLGTKISRYNGVAWVDYNLSSVGSILQGGNSFGTTMIIGTNDAFGLALRVNTSTFLSVTSSGNATFNGQLTVTLLSTFQNVALTGTLTMPQNVQVQWATGQQKIIGTGGIGKFQFISPAGGYTFNFMFGAADYFVVSETGIKTPASSVTGGAGEWELGKKIGGAFVFDGTQTIRVKVDGAVYNLALAL